MNKSRIAHLFLAAMLIMAFFLPGSVVAQDPVTTELIELPVVATTEAGEPVYGVILPTVGPSDTTPVPEATPAPASPVDSTTANTMINGLFLLVGVLVVALLVLVFLVLRSRAASGDEAAQRWLTMLNAGRDNFFPQGQTEAWIARQEAQAKATPQTLLDDAAIALIKAGWQVIAPQQGASTQTVTATVTSTSEPTGSTAAKPSTPYPPATGTPMDTDLTRSKTATLPTRPSDGGASGGGTGFPPVR